MAYVPSQSTKSKPRACLERLRYDAGLTLPELAQRVGYSHSHIVKVVNGRTDPGEKLIWALADVFGQRRSELADALRRETQDVAS